MNANIILGEFSLKIVVSVNSNEWWNVKLDLASGTGTFALILKEIQPRAAIIGLDADPQVLEIAQQKATNKRIDITFQQGLSSDLPFEDDQLDKVFSSLFFHHLTLDMKQKTLEEAFRVLTPGGDIYILDFDRPQNLWMRIAFFSIQLLDGFETTRDHVKGIILESLHEEGFTEVKETDHFNTIAGTIRLYHARKPVWIYCILCYNWQLICWSYK